MEWNAFESSLVSRTDKLATFLSKPISLYLWVNVYNCYINISHCFSFTFFRLVIIVGVT